MQSLVGSRRIWRCFRQSLQFCRKWHWNLEQEMSQKQFIPFLLNPCTIYLHPLEFWRSKHFRIWMFFEKWKESRNVWSLSGPETDALLPYPHNWSWDTQYSCKDCQVMKILHYFVIPSTLFTPVATIGDMFLEIRGFNMFLASILCVVAVHLVLKLETKR